MLLGLAALPFIVLDVFDTNVAARRPAGLVVAPFYPGGIWAVAADLSVGAVAVAVTALAIHGSVLRRAGYEISRPLAVATVAVTGWAPYLGFHLLAVSGAVSFLLTLVVFRFTARPSTRTEPERWPIRPLLVTLAVAALLLGSYAIMHPLREASLGSFTSSDGRHGTTIDVRNRGFAAVKILDVDPPLTAGQFPFYNQSLRGQTIRADKKASVLVSARACASLVIHVRYRLLGHEWTQPLLLPKNCD